MTRTADHPTAVRRRRLVLVAAGLVVALLAGIGIALAIRPTTPQAGPSPSPSTGTEFERPAGSDPARPALHLTPERDWMNDPQRPFLLDGVWHYYYLYNADHPDGNGTAWYHATSTDLVHWTDEGVAIDKYTNGLGDIWTGTAVVDTENTAGFGPGAVVAMVTQQSDGVQRQSLFVSHDGGYRFEPYAGNPVIDNPGVRDFRDPRLVWDESHRRWIMALAEGGKIGFYTSPDLKDWTYRSGFTAPDLGVLECPDLFAMSVDGDPSRVRWVLAAGANGAAEGMTTGTVYWTGDWDGETFTPDDPRHQWLDRGSDYYAAVTWDDPRQSAEERLATRYGIGWLNNWAYAGDVPGDEWSGGSDSIVRSLRLVERDGRATLESRPVDALSGLEGPAADLEETTIDADGEVRLPEPHSDAYRVRMDVAVDASAGELRLRVPRGDGSFATVGYDPATERVFVARDADAIAGRMPDVYRDIRTAPVAARDGRIRLDVIVDVASIEVFTGDGVALSMVTGTAAGTGTEGLRAEAVGGDVRVVEASVTPLRVAAVKRAD